MTTQFILFASESAYEEALRRLDKNVWVTVSSRLLTKRQEEVNLSTEVGRGSVGGRRYLILFPQGVVGEACVPHIKKALRSLKPTYTTKHP